MRSAPRARAAMSDQSSAIPYIGSKISLISNAEIRYEGILHTLNTQASNISLQSVRCFGTEGRKEPDVPPTNEVYDFIIFRGRDIKDLTVLSGSYAAQSLQMNDPAIMSVNQRPAGGKGAKGAAPKGASGSSSGEARGDRPDRKSDAGYGKGSSSKGDGFKGASKGWDKGGAKGSGKGAKGTAKGADSGKSGKASKGKDEGEKGGKAGKAKGGASSAADGILAKGGAKGSKDSGKGSKDSKGKDADAKGKSKGEARAKGNGRSSGRRGRGGGDDALESGDINGESKDFDYAAASARFEKSRSEDGNSAPKSGYDKSKSFFDNISGEAGDPASHPDRSKADRDSETFGDGEAARPAGGRHRKGARRGGAPRGSKA